MKSFGVVCGVLAGIALLAVGGCRSSREEGVTSAFAAPGRELDELSPSIDLLIESQRKRIMGRRTSLRDVRRIVAEISPLIERVLRSPEVQTDLRALAAAVGTDVDAYRRYFQAKQEADLLLESGGNPDAISVSNAVGVAQFLAGTGRRCGLRVNEAAARACTRRMARHREALRWLDAQPESFCKPAPDWAGGIPWSRDQWRAFHQRRWEEDYQERRRWDERFDPARAIAAQTRYLLRLARHYGGLDWALQAYHGGEGGVNRTANLFVRGSRSMSLLPDWVRTRLRGPNRLSYERLYLQVSPLEAPSVFNYLYGRADDHRYYWWKVRMAERAITAYRRDPAAFRRQWEALRPGQRTEAVWYPDRERWTFADKGALRAAYARRELVPLPPAAKRLGLHTADLAPLDPKEAGTYKGLRPEAMETLLRVARLYRRNGGKGALTVIGMTSTEVYSRALNEKFPQVPPPGTDPNEWEPTLDYHPTGLCFDLRLPARDWDRKVLFYALSRLADGQRINWLVERILGPERIHVVPNPAYREEQAAYCPAPRATEG
ncbi:MAG: hypothetical protein HY320_10725 [Armatimonadetes bacterium]|nr:hypothetical protein [Armatimonadota bacterium]